MYQNPNDSMQSVLYRPSLPPRPTQHKNHRVLELGSASKSDFRNITAPSSHLHSLQYSQSSQQAPSAILAKKKNNHRRPAPHSSLERSPNFNQRTVVDYSTLMISHDNPLLGMSMQKVPTYQEQPSVSFNEPSHLQQQLSEKDTKQEIERLKNLNRLYKDMIEQEYRPMVAECALLERDCSQKDARIAELKRKVQLLRSERKL